MPPILAIIVPVYNVEKYLRECIDSILNQTFTDFSLILVDDGSTDMSGSICDDYATHDNRITVFHKPNGGVSSARNMALDKLGGGYKWLTFIDSDDFISADFLENLLKPTIENNDLDFVHGGCTNYWNKENQYTVEQDYESTISMDKILLLEKIRGLLPSKLFSATIVEKIRLRFDERVKIAEDMIFTIEYIRHVDKYSFIEEKGYFYRRYSGSATQSSVNRDYISQLACFKHFNQAVSDYKDAYSIEHSEIRDMQLGESIVRTAINLYRGLYPRKERLNRLHSDFNVNELSLLKYVTRNKMEKILANILKNRHYRLFDAITSMLFYIKNILVCHSFK